MSHPSPAPIFLGSDLGVYSMARSFHEAYGAVSHTIAELPRGFINDSGIVTPVLLGAEAEERLLVDAVLHVAEEARARGDRPVLVVNSDSQVDLVQRNRDELEAATTVIVPSEEHSDAVGDKARLAPLAEAVGLTTPREVEIDATAPEAGLAAAAELPRPFILKPASSSEWEGLSFPGKLKVYVCDDVGEVRGILEASVDAGFGGRLLAQELIPGDDTAGYVVTAYIGQSGEAVLQATARMLLAIHTPNLLGNQAIGLVDWYPEMAEPVVELLNGLDYRGFATVDIKVHSRTGVPYLLDINPRPGRSNYFINVGGSNPMQMALNDAWGIEQAPERTREKGIFRIVPFALTRRYVSGPLLAEARAAARKRMAHPLDYRPDNHPKRRLFRGAASFNHIRNLARTYPRPTETSF